MSNNEKKVKIIEWSEAKNMVAVTPPYNMNCSVILKNKDKIMEHMKLVALRMSAIIWKKCGKVMEVMEKLLCVWVQDQRQH